MCLSKFSNLKLLKQVALNLYSSDEHEKINELCEQELAALINTFYQGEFSMSGEKRKIENDSRSDSKKIKVYVNKKASSILSALEMLPNEIFEMITKNLGSADKKNLRMTSIGIYHKITLVAPMFKDWCFRASRGTPPEFVLEADKNFCVYDLKEQESDPTLNLINYFKHRISSIKIDMRGLLLDYLNGILLYSNNCMKTNFRNLISLDLEKVQLCNKSFLVLAPQLENLRICHGSSSTKEDFDISSVDEHSKSFTKLKTLDLSNVNIDLKKILTKCCKTLEYLNLKPLVFSYDLENLDEELSSLSYLGISLYPSKVGGRLRALLSRCSGSLKTLNIVNDYCNIDFSTQLNQPMKITTLKLEFIDKGNIDTFLNKCPLIQNLTLIVCKIEVNSFVLKDLRTLELAYCKDKCVTSLLKQATESSLKTLHLKYLYNFESIEECELPVIPELDTLWIYDETTEIGKCFDMFPAFAKVAMEKMSDKAVFRRVYGLS